MFGLFRRARRGEAPSRLDLLAADHDRALAERRAARPARRHAGEAAHEIAEDRQQRLARDPIWSNREHIMRSAGR